MTFIDTNIFVMILNSSAEVDRVSGLEVDLLVREHLRVRILIAIAGNVPCAGVEAKIQVIISEVPAARIEASPRSSVTDFLWNSFADLE